MAQSDAERKLQAAVEEYVKEECDAKAVLRSWLLITDQCRWDEDGDQTTCIGTAYSNGTLPDHVVIGLCEMVSARAKADFMNYYTEGLGDDDG